MDHFIPWSFIKDDQLWNFVLACPKCNESKKDKLPDEMFLERIIRRNDKERLLKYTQLFANYRSRNMRQIYVWAMANGYQEIWRPKERMNEQ